MFQSVVSVVLCTRSNTELQGPACSKQVLPFRWLTGLLKNYHSTKICLTVDATNPARAISLLALQASAEAFLPCADDHSHSCFFIEKYFIVL